MNNFGKNLLIIYKISIRVDNKQKKYFKQQRIFCKQMSGIFKVRKNVKINTFK